MEVVDISQYLPNEFRPMPGETPILKESYLNAVGQRRLVDFIYDSTEPGDASDCYRLVHPKLGTYSQSSSPHLNEEAVNFLSGRGVRRTFKMEGLQQNWWVIVTDKTYKHMQSKGWIEGEDGVPVPLNSRNLLEATLYLYQEGRLYSLTYNPQRMPMSGTGRQLAQFGPDSENISLEAGHWKPDQSHKYGRFMSKYIQLFAELAHKSIKSGIYNISSIVPSIQQEMQSQGLSKEKSG